MEFFHIVQQATPFILFGIDTKQDFHSDYSDIDNKDKLCFIVYLF